MNTKKLKYRGETLLSCKMIGNKELSPYIPSNALKDAVNLMILLRKRPLLIMGEPGCGKTRLAEAIAYDLYGEKYQEYYFEWNIKSTTKAKDGLYRYDALKRLSDAQIEGKRKNIDNLELDVEGSYIERGELANAFKASKIGKPAVILIDEIDKADLDFPNDLLTELEKFEFTIEETGKKIPPPESMPLIFITSNGEKELPPAFLRRCIFHYIKFPDVELLKSILSSHFSDTENDYINKAVIDFMGIRKKLEIQIAISEKKVSTSELIDWFSIVSKIINLKKQPLDSLEDFEIKFLKSLDQWITSEAHNKIPFYQVLLKNVESRKVLKDSILDVT